MAIKYELTPEEMMMLAEDSKKHNIDKIVFTSCGGSCQGWDFNTLTIDLMRGDEVAQTIFDEEEC